MPNDDSKKKPNQSDTPSTAPPPPNDAEIADGEMADDDLDAVSGGLRTTGPIVTKPPPVCLSLL